jgi:exonuclease VII small subunit
MKRKKMDGIKKITEITEKIDSRKVPLDKGINLLGKAGKAYKELKKDLFAKKGKVLIAKDDGKGKYNLQKFDEE